MATVKQRGETWQYTISRYVDGKYAPIRKGGFKTRKECTIAAAEAELQLSKGIETKTKNKSFADYFANWVETYKKNKHKNTYDRYVNSVNRVKEHFKDKPIQKINREMYQNFINWYALSDNGKTYETVRKLNTHIRACVKDAMEEGYIGIDFTRKVELFGGKESKSNDEKFIDFDECDKLYNALFQRLKIRYLSNHLILLALVTGMRYGELVGLQVKDFNFETNMLNIERAYDYKDGDGYGPLKNAQSKRNIKVDKNVMHEFKKLFLAKGWIDKQEQQVFHQPTKVGCITNEAANKQLRKILNELEIDEITMHGLRHTHASVLLYKQVSIYSVSQRLGHADIQTTMDHYAHVLKEMRERDETMAADVFADMKIVL